MMSSNAPGLKRRGFDDLPGAKQHVVARRDLALRRPVAPVVERHHVPEFAGQH